MEERKHNASDALLVVRSAPAEVWIFTIFEHHLVSKRWSRIGRNATKQSATSRVFAVKVSTVNHAFLLLVLESTRA